ncbi:hypothetical protein OIV83_004115 [Microbotryomycetes sp. JL201]|nr:hypothetical protein OIV83_004115 [Microbotryomycetes sp. JL201]
MLGPSADFTSELRGWKHSCYIRTKAMGAGNAGPPSTNSLTVTDNRTGKTIHVPIENNSVPATAFKQLKKQQSVGERDEDEVENGLRVYDPGQVTYMNTAVIQSKITYIDGENGVLRYRGYPIEQLAAKSSFLEVAYLLIYGELPGKSQLKLFEAEVLHHSYVHRDLEKLVGDFNDQTHPMSLLVSAFAAMGSFDQSANPALAGQKLYANGGTRANLEAMDKQIFRLIGKSITVAAMAWKIYNGRQFNSPPTGSNLDYTSSFLYMLDNLNEKDFKPHPVFAKALDILFILHADHEMNCSAAAMLQVGSSLADPFSCVSAATAALYGPLHGGANEAVIKMLIEIGSPENVPAFIEKVKRKEAVLSGFGHRIYRKTDPRSEIVRKVADEVFAVTGSDPLLETAMALYDAALKEKYFVERRLYANVDFFTGLIYRAMAFPPQFFTVLFATPRVVGWVAHWRQMMLQQAGVKIWRPRQVYLGSGKRDYVPMEHRTEDMTRPKHPSGEPTQVKHLFSKRLLLSRDAKI